MKRWIDHRFSGGVDEGYGLTVVQETDALEKSNVKDQVNTLELKGSVNRDSAKNIHVARFPACFQRGGKFIRDDGVVIEVPKDLFSNEESMAWFLAKYPEYKVVHSSIFDTNILKRQ